MGEASRLCSDVPIVLCGNKNDVEERKVEPAAVRFPRKIRLQYYDISAKSNYNIEKPFLWLARKLLDKPDLDFVEAAILQPAQTTVDIELLAKHKREFTEAVHWPSDEE